MASMSVAQSAMRVNLGEYMSSLGALSWRLTRERQDALYQFISKFLFLFKKREMAGIVKPDKFLLRSIDRFDVLQDQGRTTVWVVSPFEKEDRYAELGPESTEIDFYQLGKQNLA